MTRGKVVLVVFPFDDLAAEKARPAICLTEPMGAHRHIVLAFVTSRQPDDPLDTDVVLDPDDSDFAQTGLHVRSTVRAHRLLTVSSRLIKRELGSLSPQRQELVNQAVRRLFETADAPEGSGLIWNDLSSQLVVRPIPEAASVAVEAAIATVDHSDIRGSRPHNRDPSGATSD